MEEGKETEVLIRAIEEAQAVLGKYTSPDSGMTAEECVQELLGILDNRELIATQERFE